MKKILTVISSPTCCDYYYSSLKTGETYCSLLKKYLVCPPEDREFPKDCPLEDAE